MSENTQNKTPNLALNGNSAVVYYIIGLIVLILDQISKHHFEAVMDLGDTITLIDPVFNWTLAYNHGAAFSFLANQDGWQKWFFALLGLVVSGFIIAYLRKVPKSATLLSVGLAMVLGGAIGNVIDRVLYGYVIDFIHVHYADAWHYPIFNVADIGISIGMVLVVFDMLFLEKKRNQTTI